MIKDNVFIFDHPLIQHKISLMRDKRTTTKEFRELVSEVSMLMAYEVTRNLPLKEIEVETPIATAKTWVLAGKTGPASHFACRSGHGGRDVACCPWQKLDISVFTVILKPLNRSNIIANCRKTPRSETLSFWTQCWRPVDRRWRP